MTKRPLNALVLEDSEDDAILVVRELGRQGFEVKWERAWTAPAMKSLLEAESWDVVLSDYSMPGFGAPAALQLLHGTGLDLPFIVISGTIGEEAAVAAMKNGAHDYLMKGNLKRLCAAIDRELRDAEVRRAHRLAVQKIEHLNRVLRAIRNVNQLIATETDRKRLLDRAAALLVETRGYTSALCVHLDGNQQPDFVAYSVDAGESAPAPESTFLEAGLTACMKEALRSNGPVLIDKDSPDCGDCPLCSAFPDSHCLARAIVRDDRTFGVLAIAMPRGIAPDAEELELLEEAAGDLGLALHGIEAERLQKEQQERFRIITESSPDAIFIMDGRGNYTYVNSAACELLGYSYAELTSRSIADILPPEKLDPGIAWFKELLVRGKGFAAIDLVRKDETKVPVELNAVVLPNGQVYGSGRDVTDRKNMQAQMAQSDRLATMGMLAAGVAHEINNPLAYVLYNLESLTDDLPKLSTALRRCLDVIDERVGNEEWSRLMGKDQELLNPAMLEDIRKRFKDALQGSHRIRDVARGLGTFSRVERDRLVPVALMHVIEVAISMAFNEIKYRARLVKEYGRTSTILANDGRLSQVFLNLLINAAHSITEGDLESNEIRVRTWQEGDEVFAEVRDTGKGISNEDLPHLFEPFFTTKEIGVGTGLGLPISKSIVEEYGGRIEVESEVGKGTSFVVRLPVEKVAGEDEAAQVDQVATSSGVRGRILVVDDEAGIRSAMVRMLRGHDVVQARSGGEARKILEADQAFDLILCDMMMPVMSGVALHEWLLSTHPELAKQVVFITGGAFTPRAREHLSKASNIRIEKPFDVANFQKIVGELIVAYRNRGS